MSDEVIRDLAHRAGIAVEWQDFAGRPKTVEPDVLRHLLEALGLPCKTRGDLLASRRLLQRRSNVQALPPLITAMAGRPTRLDVGASDTHKARLSLEGSGTRDIAISPVRGRLRVPAISETGYHRLLIEDREFVLAVAPTRCRTIDDAVPDARLWGIAAQVYSLRHCGDGGIGDAAGIAALAEAVGSRGADALALSPLHALFGADPSRFGPYSPSTRLFLNPLHASPAQVFGEAHVADTLRAEGLSETFQRLEALSLIDWPAAARAKHRLLRALFEPFIDAASAYGKLHLDFARFRADGGELLAQHAVFETLHAVQAAAGAGDWHRWPTDLRDPNSAAVTVFAASHEREVLFHSFLQWLADRSFGIAQSRALGSGMRIGLIGDLAVGMDPSGSHAWSRQGDVLGSLSIGAPPDLLNPRGQDWGLTSFSPRALIAGGFGPFIATVRAALRNTGGLRIDHAMGLTRLWLIPQGADPADGAYLTFPLTDLLRLLALESQRHAAIVVGEDLGTVPDGFHDALETAGIHGMRVLWFERNGHGFNPPETWSHSAVAMTSTHDLPTVAGWWHGSDITTRAESGRLGVGVQEADVSAERTEDRRALWQEFVEAGFGEGDAPSSNDTQPVVDAALAFVAATPSPLCLPPIEDLLGIEEQPNLPGTIDQHPNWRRRLTAEARTLLDEPRIARRVAQLATRRPRL
ncbi:MAG TPA: 4-alpha-glucanotransferase [Acetobacteraceae bacterium]|jgi:4-alpha-glucanotransferase|nr:4-alpha-glucanotransferase [Acetobacteraceae bacterium]